MYRNPAKLWGFDIVMDSWFISLLSTMKQVIPSASCDLDFTFANTNKSCVIQIDFYKYIIYYWDWSNYLCRDCITDPKFGSIELPRFSIFSESCFHVHSRGVTTTGVVSQASGHLTFSSRHSVQILLLYFLRPRLDKGPHSKTFIGHYNIVESQGITKLFVQSDRN